MATEQAGRTRKRTARTIALAAALLFQGLSGLVGGIGLVADPSGAFFQFPETWLDGSPFGDYLIPGLILLVVLGAGPLIALVAVWRRLPWARRAAQLVGVGLIVWIAVEVVIIGYQPEPPLQLIYEGVGLLILLLTLKPLEGGAVR
jgi:peptidoglycan/LPS O-acetylase OafA/YrhL